MTLCFEVSISLTLSCAGFPHKIKTTSEHCSDTVWIISLVNSSQPIFLCECASPARTVNTVFNNKTPSFAQSCKCGDVRSHPISSASSLYIFLNDGGNLALGCTEKAKPCA